MTRSGTAQSRCVMRVGLPLTGGALLSAARGRAYPVLFSANAFAATYPKGHERDGFFRQFRRPDWAQLRGVDAALDSGGFVAACRYGDYRWTLEDYFDLVEAFPWTWYAAMDYCCEPEVASNRPIRLLRIAATANLLGRCQREAARRGLPGPMPVLQGWTPGEYVTCAEWLALREWPSLVGLGSVCRRELRGSNGLSAVLSAVDAVLPSHVKLHLFGVKSTALAALAGHPRIVSADSMAWDLGARAARRTGRDMAFRAEQMHAWVGRQGERIAAARPGSSLQGSLFDVRVLDEPEGLEDTVVEAVALQFADLVLWGEVDYSDAVAMCRYDAVVAVAMLKHTGLTEGFLSDLDDLLAGAGERLSQMLAAA